MPGAERGLSINSSAHLSCPPAHLGGRRRPSSLRRIWRGAAAAASVPAGGRAAAADVFVPHRVSADTQAAPLAITCALACPAFRFLSDSGVCAETGLDDVRPSDADAELDENEGGARMANVQHHDASDVHSRAGGVAARAGAVLARLGGGPSASVPVTLRFWDGSELPAPADCRPAGVLHVRREAIGDLLRQPNQLGLARAYVSGALELDGELELLLAERHRLRDGPTIRLSDRLAAAAAGVAAAGPSAIRAGSRPATEARPRGRLHSPARDRERRAPPLRRLQRVLPAAPRTVAGLLLRLLRNARRRSGDGAGAQARADLPQAASGARRAAARHRLWLGLADHPRRARHGVRARRPRDSTLT